MTRISLILVILTFLIILVQHYVYSYCIYNKMSDSTELFVYQDDGQNNLAHAEE